MPRCPLKIRITPLLPFHTKESPGRLAAASGLVPACAEPQRRCGGGGPAAFGAFLSARAPGRAACASAPWLMRCDSKCRCNGSGFGEGWQLSPGCVGTRGVREEGSSLSQGFTCHFAIPSVKRVCASRISAERNPRRGQGQAATDGPSPARDTGDQPLLGLPKPWFGVRARNDPGQGVLILPVVLVTLLGCPVAIARATVTGHSLPGVHHLRDGPMPSPGDGAQVGALDPPSPFSGGIWPPRHSQVPPQRRHYPAEGIGALLGALLPISSASPRGPSAVHGVAFPCLRVSMRRR